MSRTEPPSLAALVRLLILAFLSAPAPAAGQSLFVAAGAALPLGDFAAVAEPGYQLLAGGSVGLGETPVSVGMVGLYGRNGHEVAGERSELYSVSALVGYRAVQRAEIALDLWGGLGGAVHARSSDAFPGLDASKRGFVVTGGVTGSYALERVKLFLFGAYLRGLGGLGSSRYPTELVTVGAGASIPLRSD